MSFDAPSGSDVRATVYGTADCGVVLVPQINRDRESWRPQAERIVDEGYLALAIDEDPDHRADSVRGAIEFLHQELDVSAVVLVGASSGGEAVVRAAAAAPSGSVSGLLTLSAGGGADVAGQLPTPSRFVVASGDDDRFVQVAHDLHEGAPEPTELVTFDGSAHGQALFEAHGSDLWRHLLEVLSRGCESSTAGD